MILPDEYLSAIADAVRGGGIFVLDCIASGLSGSICSSAGSTSNKRHKKDGAERHAVPS